jgi:hypothetical protein
MPEPQVVHGAARLAHVVVIVTNGRVTGPAASAPRVASELRSADGAPVGSTLW